VALLLWSFHVGSDVEPQFLAVPALVVLLIGIAALSPYLALLAARGLVRRARSAPTLLAARRLALDPRPAARAALAAGAGGLTVGVLGGLMADLVGETSSADEPYQAMKLVLVLTVIGFVLIALALAVHVADTVLGERRAYAALSAVGFSTRALLSALRWEALMATLPVALLGALIGSGGYSLLADEDGPWLKWSALALVGTVVSAVASTFVAAALVAPVVRSAVTTGSLRTE
jgi:hypothetical protein